MIKKRFIKKAIEVLSVTMLLSGTIAQAATMYDYGPYTIQTENVVYTPTKAKKVSGSAYVDQQLSKNSVLRCTMYNAGTAVKSATTTITGVSHGYISYSGYGVDIDDTLRLRIQNASSSGGTVTVEGSWRP